MEYHLHSTVGIVHRTPPIRFVLLQSTKVPLVRCNVHFPAESEGEALVVVAGVAFFIVQNRSFVFLTRADVDEGALDALAAISEYGRAQVVDAS